MGKEMKLLLLLLILNHASAQAAELRTNAAVFPSAPAWLTPARVNRVVDQIQTKLEWDIRRITVHTYADAASFQREHKLDPAVLAFSRKDRNSVYLGPRVDTGNFDFIFGHELVHIILGQKYKAAIPAWLEEGLANHLGKMGRIDYAWLAKQPKVGVRSLVHPFLNSSVGWKQHYMASTALAEMISSHCSLSELLQLSVGKNLETYLGTFCEIQDIDTAFQKWLTKMSSAR